MFGFSFWSHNSRNSYKRQHETGRLAAQLNAALYRQQDDELLDMRIGDMVRTVKMTTHFKLGYNTEAEKHKLPPLS